MVQVRLVSLRKRFGTVVAVDDVSLDVADKEFFAFLGPSGCGKTTMLRMIAGFESPDEGQIFLDDKPINHVPPHLREVGMVFQNYALWPHMTVFQNIAFGLSVRKSRWKEIKERVNTLLELVHLQEVSKRYPNQLSGGQQQRVALARALAIQPKVLLLDEPLSNLDAKLRVDMRREIRLIQKELGITTLYVTHDQEEAFSLSDRLAVINEGKIVQIGEPSSIYVNPANEFVADFLSRANLLSGKVSGLVDAGVVRLSLAGTTVQAFAPHVSLGEKVTCCIRPESIRISKAAKNGNDADSIECVVRAVYYMGKLVRYDVVLPSGSEVTVDHYNPDPSEILSEGSSATLKIDPRAVSVLSSMSQ